MSCRVCLKPCRKASHLWSRCSVEKEVDWMTKATLQGRQATLSSRTCLTAVVETLDEVPGCRANRLQSQL